MSRRRHPDHRAKSKPFAAPPAAPAPTPQSIPAWLEWAVENGFWVTLAVAASARLIHWISIYTSDPLYAQTLVKCDMDTYWQWARRIAAGDWLSEKAQPGPFYYGPLYPYFLAVLFRIFGENFHVVHGMQALIGLVSPLLLWSIGRRLFGKGPALATGLMAAVCVPFLFYEQTLLMEGLLIAIHAAILWCLVRGQETLGGRAWLWALAGGAFSGLACWGRGIFILVIPALAAVWLFLPALHLPAPESACGATTPPSSPPRATRLRLRTGALCAATYLLGVALLLAVTLWRNHHVSGQWVVTTSNGPILLYVGNASDSRGIFFYPPSFKTLEERYGSQGAVPWVRELLRDLAAHPFAFVRLTLKKTWMFWNSYDIADNISYYLCKRYSRLLQWSPATWVTIVPLGVLGMWESRKHWRRQVFLYTYGGMFALSIIAVFIVGRYRLEELLPMLVWAGPAIAIMARHAWEKHWGSLGARAAALVGGMALLWPIWSPAVAHNTPKKMTGIHLVRPNDYNPVALAHLELKQRQQAREILEEGVAQYPYFEAIAFPLSTIYIEDGKPQKAVTILQDYLRIRGHERNGLLRLANALSLCGRKSESMELVQSILRSNPEDAEASATLVRIQGRQ